MSSLLKRLYLYRAIILFYNPSVYVRATNENLNITSTNNVISGGFTVTDTSNKTLFSITNGVVNALALTVTGITLATTA